jgi:hypothetical protein
MTTTKTIKSAIVISVLCISMSAYSQCTTGLIPNMLVNAPNKLCYDYDRAGNRVEQNPAWICPEYSPEIKCTSNDPETYITSFGRTFLYPPLGGEPSNPNTGGSVSVWTSTGSVTSGGSNNRSIAEKATEKPSITIHIIPNPNIGQFKVAQQGFDIDNSRIFIFNAHGVLVFDREYVSGEVNVSDLPVGVYHLKLVDFFNEQSVKFEKKQ